MKARARIEFHAGRVSTVIGGTTTYWRRTSATSEHDTWERDRYRIDIWFTKQRGAIKAARLTGPVGSYISAPVGDGVLAETVMNWMSDPTRFIKPPAIGVIE